MTKEEKIIREYFENISDINQSKSIKVLPLTLVDMLLEYESDYINLKPSRYKCLLCGRDKFTRPTSHYCNGVYRKRKIKWEKIYD